MKQSALLGACSGFGQKRSGVDLAPALFRRLLKENSYNDVGDVREFATQHSNRTQRAWSVITKLEHAAYEALKKHSTLLTIGGDHSIAAGTISATLKHHPDARVVYMDAHGDINTRETSPTGNLHGMPLAALLQLFENPLASPALKPENLFFIGVRDLDSGEKQIIEQHKIQIVTAREIREDRKATLEKFRSWLRRSSSPVHFSFDVDALDPSVASATGIHVEDGLSTSEARAFTKLLQAEAQVIAVDLVELNPTVGDLEHTLHHVETILREIHFVRKMFAARWPWHRPRRRALSNVTSRRVLAT